MSKLKCENQISNIEYGNKNGRRQNPKSGVSSTVCTIGVSFCIVGKREYEQRSILFFIFSMKLKKTLHFLYTTCNVKRFIGSF